MDGGFTLPGKHYTDPDLFRRELERIFFSMWVYVGRTEEMPTEGSYIKRDVGGENLIVLNSGSDVRAFSNVCRHRGTELCADQHGELQHAIKCPYHGWTYDFTGRLIGAAFMPEGFNRDDYPLHAIAADTWEGHVFVNLSARPAPLTEQLADLPHKFAPWRMEELRLAHRITYDIATNWKLIVLNYNECLHCPVIHPVLNRLHHYLGADNEQPSDKYIGGSMGFKPGVQTMTMDGRLRRAYLPGLGEREQTLVAYYVVYPNSLLSLHPDYMLTHSIWPIAPDRTRIVCEWHFHPDQMSAPGFDPSDAVEFWDLTNREDWAISEKSYAGIRSRGYVPGPYSTRETLLHAFDQWVLRKLGDESR